jgi:hypothetical protein
MEIRNLDSPHNFLVNSTCAAFDPVSDSPFRNKNRRGANPSFVAIPARCVWHSTSASPCKRLSDQMTQCVDSMAQVLCGF